MGQHVSSSQISSPSSADSSLSTGANALATLELLQERISALEEQQSPQAPDCNKMNLLVFDSSRDRLLAAFVMATGAAACGMDVSMFFTFWATAAMRKGCGQFGRKTLVERAFGWMLPGSLSRTRLSQMDMCGMGRFLMGREMKKKNVADLDQLLDTAGDLGVRICVCEMSMRLMGIRREELIDYPQLEYCGVAKFVEQASHSNTTLFI